MSFRPLHDRVVVRRLEGEEKTKGGIIIPDTAKEKPSEGVIEAVGPGARDESGKLVPLDVKAGDKIVGREPVRQTRIRGPRECHHPLKGRPIEVGHLTDELLRAFPRTCAARGGRVEQGLDAIARRAPLRVVLGFVRAWQCRRGHTLFPGDRLGWGVQ